MSNLVVLYLITELYGQLSGKRVVLCITKGQLSGKRVVLCITKGYLSGTLYYKSSEALIASLVFENNICSLTRYAVHDTLPSKLVLVGGKKARENKQLYCLLWFFCHSAGWLHTLVTNEVI